MTNQASHVQRLEPRRRSLKEGKVVLTDWTVIDCIIRDISSSGARLEFAAATNLPSDCRLLVASTNMLIPAVRVWQQGLMAGIRFTGPEQPAPPRKF